MTKPFGAVEGSGPLLAEALLGAKSNFKESPKSEREVQDAPDCELSTEMRR